MQTYADFKTEMRRDLWPGGEPERLRQPHDRFFLAAMMDLQRNVPCLRQNNVTLFQFCNTYWERFKSVMEMPKGKVIRIYTIANSNWEDRVWYRSGNFHEIENWADTLVNLRKPGQTNVPSLPQGFRYPNRDANSEERARTGMWAIHNHRLYIAPQIQSNETVVMEWSGEKSVWADADPVATVSGWWTQEVKEAIKAYVMWRHELFYGDKSAAAVFELDWLKQRAEIMHDCREKTKQQEDLPRESGKWVTQEDLEDDAVPDESTTFTVCVTGDSGAVGDPLSEVAEAILGESPGRIILNGDITYGEEYADVVGAYFPDLSKIFPTIGNHDIDFDSTLEAFQEYFTATLKGNKRYYDFVYGPFHFFMLATDPREEDGGYTNATTSTQTSAMGEWLRVKLAMSTAKYKIVVGHHAPYTSDVSYTPGNRWMRWPFKTWGANLYIGAHGHNAEYIIDDGFPYVQCGIGGHSLRAFGADTDADEIMEQFNSNYGFLKLTGNCSEATVELKTRAGVSVFTFDL